MNSAQLKNKREQLINLLKQRILVLDGAMGTTVFALGIDEASMRGAQLAGHHKELKNFVDILCLTRPEAVTQIHRQFLEAGADIIETNTFGSSPIGMAEFQLPAEMVRKINLAAAACAQGGRRIHGAHTRAATICGRVDRPDGQDSLDFPQGRRSRLSSRDVRPAR